MRLNIMIGFAAIALGTALASVPAVAQQSEQSIPGYSSDGTVVAIPNPDDQQNSGPRVQHNSVPQHSVDQKNLTTTHYGRTLNDGGQ